MWAWSNYCATRIEMASAGEVRNNELFGGPGDDYGDELPFKIPRIDQDGDGVTMRRFSGAAIYNSRFQSSWSKKWPFVVGVKDNPSTFRCNVCSKTLSCSHQGERDVTRHISSVQHQHRAKSVRNVNTFCFSMDSEKNSIKNKV